MSGNQYAIKTNEKQRNGANKTNFIISLISVIIWKSDKAC